jgi:hypothetical protein
MAIELFSITWANLYFSVKRQVVELARRYINLSVNRDSKHSNQLSLEDANLLPILVEKDSC